jgi:hypothetical protein
LQGSAINLGNQNPPSHVSEGQKEIQGFLDAWRRN